MASSSPKLSKPLHNFDLPATLKWTNQSKPTNNHRRSSSSSSAVKSPTAGLDSNSKIQNSSPIKINPPKNNTVSDKKPDLHLTETRKPDRDEEEKVATSLDVALREQDIDEDMFSFFGRKHTKRPRKREMSVQKKLDCLFPGLGLTNITADKYKVSENDMKG